MQVKEFLERGYKAGELDRRQSGIQEIEILEVMLMKF